ncbi:sigma-54 interaction domain-containing protein [Gudongella oleilytica]|jgi:arginine utilization regulatory protein|uniref:sigma-54 interaction domain-containing protein n=1 Tax=Gudongella oleilytica TaxID=1582259 RepID=UPI000EC60FA3|nr:sigma 54-interacting transcriptional regulator [Gudongella oleilytica]HCO19116.1 sigma-54-dependent Fis family transcriptional regulator [Tissierellales bacterium]
MKKADLNELLVQNILRHGNIGIHVIDKERKTIVYNEAMAELEGLEIFQVMDRDILDIFPSLNEYTSTLIKVMNSGEPIINSTQTYFNYRGHSITTISSTLPLISDGHVIGAMEIAQDVTNLRKLSDQLLELQQELKQTKQETKKTPQIRKYNFTSIIGNNRSLSIAKEIAERASETASSVLIFGETGTGKEMFAQSIHNHGVRKGNTFIAQNCAAIPDSLLEGILFGTEKGGFTGAIEREGIFEQANGGTLLLDEINSMSLPLQAKLLRVLQEGYIRRIGGIRDIPVDVRIIATTNEDPKVSLENGTLRRDLYYRLSVINIHIPPLRDRLDDLKLLIKFFIQKYNELLNKNIDKVSEEVMEDFRNYSWPGNIRELENFIEGAMNMVSSRDKVLNRENFITSSFIPKGKPLTANLSGRLPEETLPEILEDVERSIIQEIMKRYDHNISNTARHLGIKRQTLQYKLRKD